MHDYCVRKNSSENGISLQKKAWELHVPQSNYLDFFSIEHIMKLYNVIDID